MSKRVLFAVLLLTLSVIGHCAAAQPMIELAIGGKTQSFSQGALLARPDAAEIHVPRDVAYGTSTTYRAVPLADLLDSAALPADSVLEARATDGFAAQHASATELAAALVKLYRDNASTLTPDSVYAAFHYSHPPALERITRLRAATAAS